jgi:hypothetical protein
MSTENETETIQNITKKSNRSFKVKLEEDGVQYGRYNGDSPYQAANKALSEIIRNKIKNNQGTEEDITFFLVESTKGSNKKIHQYVGKRIKLVEPVSYIVKNGDKEQKITKEFKNILRKIKKGSTPELTLSEVATTATETATATATVTSNTTVTATESASN